MAKTMKGCVQLFLKLVNSTMGVVGISMVVYSVWMARVWQRDMEGSSSDYYNYSSPWFIHAFLGTGITICAIACLGHTAADTANAHCLSAYMVLIFLLLLVEIAFISDIILNSDWEKDFPQDPTGRFDDFKDFVESNFESCKWIGLLIVLAQSLITSKKKSLVKSFDKTKYQTIGCSVLLATFLKTLDQDKGKSYDSDDDDNTAPRRLPLLNHSVHPLPWAVADFPFPSKIETWLLRRDHP